MTHRLPAQFVEDRALRDAARGVLMADILHARESFSTKGIATRIGNRIGDGARDVVEVAKVQADNNRGVLAILIGALLLWLARNPLLEMLGLEPSADDNAQSLEIETGTGEEPEVPAENDVEKDDSHDPCQQAR